MSARFSFSYFCSAYLYLLFVLSLFHLCFSNFDDELCIEHERVALVEFKNGLIDEANRLASWDVGEDRDCCRWDGITCDNSTGHIRSVHLRALDGNCRDNGEVSKQRLRGNLSSSLLHLKQLRHLDLSCNDFGGIQVPKFIGSLRNLRYLNLSASYFGGTIPPQLGNLSELLVLCLGSFHLTNEITDMKNNMEWLSSMRMLQHLDLSGLNLNKAIDPLQVINTIPSLLQLHLSSCDLSDMHPDVASVNLTSLSLLDLSGNSFDSPFPQWIFGLTSLVTLDLTWCQFNNLIPNHIGFHNLTSLESLYVPGNDFMNSSLVLKALSNTIAGNLISLDIRGCKISSSVLKSLDNLTSLLSFDMSENELTNTLPKPLGYSLCNLRDLDLSKNDFSNISLSRLVESVIKCKSPHLESLTLISSGLSGSIPDSLGRFAFLRSLCLTINQIYGTIPDTIGKLLLLEKLDLSNNQLNGGFPSIGGLSLLVELYLNNNQLNGSLPDSIGGLSSLEVLYLAYNKLNGVLPSSIGKLSSLEMMYISNNQLNGGLPYSIGELSSLKMLDLSFNRLNGGLPYSIGGLTSLKYLDLSNNQLTGVVTEAHFSKLVNLKYLHGEGNNLTLRPLLASWIPPFQLQGLYLNSWILGPQFPLWLQSQRDLEELDISNTQISPTIPPDSFWRSFPNLRSLDMSKNQFQGTLLSIPTTIWSLNLSSNEFRGELPDISNVSNLFLLDLSNNSFEGSLHHLLCPYSEKSTEVLYLGHNNLSGVIPECWEKWPMLMFLNLENNNLCGGIPTTFGSSYNLQSLNMYGNKLSGELHVSLTNLTDLMILELGGNKLVGCIPPWFGIKLSYLRLLNLRSNNFDGNIPHELCYLKDIQIMDLADNNLSGNIPKCFNNFSVLSGKESVSSDVFMYYEIYMENELISSDSLVMKGRMDTYSTILPLVMLMDLSNNNIYGNIPSELTTLLNLKSLNLSRNKLTGTISEKIGDMKSLETFDLSLNKLSGELPMSLSSMSFLTSFNVSYNNLTGKIPSGTQLQSFNESSFFGNELCGDPLTRSCVRVEVPKNDTNRQEEDESHGMDWGFIISMVSGFAIGFWIVFAPLIFSRPWRIAYFGCLSKLLYVVYDGINKYCF